MIVRLRGGGPDGPGHVLPGHCLVGHPVPRAPLPAQGVTPGQDDLTGRLGGHYPSVIAITDPCARPKPSARLGIILVRPVFAGCCQPLLGVGPSRRYLCDPCVGARTHTPPRSLVARIRFFTKDTGLTPRETGSTRRFTPTQQLRWGAVYRGCSHSITFGLRRSLGLQVAPTATPPGRRAARPFTPRRTRPVTQIGQRRRFMSDTDN